MAGDISVELDVIGADGELVPVGADAVPSVVLNDNGDAVVAVDSSLVTADVIDGLPVNSVVVSVI